MSFETLTSVGRRLNWCGRQYHIMRYGECYVALRSQRTNTNIHEKIAMMKKEKLQEKVIERSGES